MRAIGAVWVEPDNRNGRFRVRHRSIERVESLGSYPKREEADAFAAAFRGKLAAKAASAVPRVTAGLLLSEFAKVVFDRRVIAGYRTVSTERYRFAAYVERSPLATMPLKAVRRKQVAEWFRTLPAHLSWQTKKHALTTLRVVFIEAQRDELIDDNPCTGIVLPKPTRTKAGWTTLSLDEISRVLFVGVPAVCPAALDQHAMRTAIAFAIASGLRQGEQRALRWSDVHLDGDAPYVHVRFGAPGMPTKSGEPRNVPLFGLALEVLQEWRKVVEEYAPSNPKQLVFPRRSGAYRQKGNMLGDLYKDGKKVGRRWGYIVNAAGLTRRVRWHDLRHTAATLLLTGAWGRSWTLTEIKDYLGHSALKVTERYSHALGTLAENAARETAPWVLEGIKKHPQSTPYTTEPASSRYARCDSNTRHSASKAVPIPSDFFLVRSSPGSNRDQTPAPAELAQMLREQVAQLPRVQAVLVEEFALAVLTSAPVRLALALLRERNPHARLTLALRLAELFDAPSLVTSQAGTKE